MIVRHFPSKEFSMFGPDMRNFPCLDWIFLAGIIWRIGGENPF